MINVNGEIYDGVMLKPELDDALKHYGVLGMKWGVRKDIKKTGSISKKTKGKIKKAVNKASYRKMRRILNGLEELKADYKGEKEYNRKNKNKKGMNANNKNVKSLDKISRSTKKTSNKKGYSYTKVNRDIATKRTRDERRMASAVGQLGFGIIGNVAANSATRNYLKNKGDEHRKTYNTSNDPFYVNGVYYEKRKKSSK